jgi:hypothetical protein
MKMPTVITPRRVSLLIGFMVARLVMVSAQAADPVIMLPPLMVEERDNALQWRYVAIPGLEVLSVCSDSTTEAYIARQTRLAEMLRVLLPDRFQVHLTVPEAHVLFNEETGRARSPEIIAEMVHKAGATVTSDGVVRGEGGLPSMGRMGRYDGLQRPQIQFLPNMRLADLDVVRVFAIMSDAAGNRADFTYSSDRVAFQLARRTPALPDWFMVGMMGLYQRARIGEYDIDFKPLVWLSDEESTALARDPKRPRTLVPLQELFTYRPVASGGTPREGDRIWRAQAELFVRWAIVDATRRAQLWQWLDHLDKGAPTEDAFQACFNTGFADARDRLSDYLPTAVKRAAQLPAPKKEPTPNVKLRPATDGEIARIRGDWERLEISLVRQRYPALTQKYFEQARRTLHRAYDRGDRDPRLIAEMGLAELDGGSAAEARELLEAAVRVGVVRPRVFLELARLRYTEIEAGNAERPFTSEEAGRVLVLLRLAHIDAPPLPDVYVLANKVWLRTRQPLDADDLKLVSEGAHYFPGVPAIVLSAIQLHVASGATAPAIAFAARGEERIRDPAVKERLVQVRSELAGAAK